MTGAFSKAFDAARILAARRASGEQGTRLPQACRPQSLGEAFDIQAAVTQQLQARIGAWKCALPQEGRLTAAPIYADTVHTASPCAVFAREGQVLVEPELAFILGQDLPARATPYRPDEVDAAIARTHIALELIDSRCTPAEAAQASFAEKLADGLVNQGLFLGPQVDAGRAGGATELAIRVRHASGAEHLQQGRHPNGLPRSPLYWLVEFLRSRGQGLHAGQAVITGSYMGSFTLPLNEAVALQFGDLGALKVHFTRLTSGPFREPSKQQ
ncbi:fumarylacetoacetate hydrolase family protein [Aquabacterium sp.]|uniref:fumarylacetoacetate hydrolase family protein n=1 Tax=Aquabacterium sp. TaxID=1872578 RepID=UPI0024885A97|nr:fumarylacetoacetate hydrolase family protein [Aquabacterium sp.]MDI1260301.1 fumarylacetoacetate hydrolase family protein [Aquabacterium sp.]